MSEPAPEMPEPAAWDGCLWPVDPACLFEEWETADEGVKTRAQRLTTTTLQMLTGYTVGGCPVTIRPTAATPCGLHGDDFLLGSLYPLGACTCGSACEVVLPPPVGGLVRVLVDGEELDLGDFHIANGNILVWQGAGDCPLPRTQNVTRPDSEVGTFSISYLNSYPVDANGQWAGGILAMEYLRACVGASSKKCRLPSTVRSVARAGLSFEIPAGAFPEGLTGIREIDAYIASVRPNPKMQYASAVYTPDRPLPRVVPTSVPFE